MADVPILFSAPMVRAILDGRKTQTRRVLKSQPYVNESGEILRAAGKRREVGYSRMSPDCGKPHPDWARWRVGDRLWVRETFAILPEIERRPVLVWREACDENDCFDLVTPGSDVQHIHVEEWRSPIHMPRWASRITLEVTAVRVERLRSITDADALKEGLWPLCQPDPARPNLIWIGTPDVCRAPVREFKRVWTEIHGKSVIGSWDANPWVAVIEFKRVEQAIA